MGLGVGKHLGLGEAVGLCEVGGRIEVGGELPRGGIAVAVEVGVDEEGEILRDIDECHALEGHHALELDVCGCGHSGYLVDIDHSFECEFDFGEGADEFHLFVTVGLEVLGVGLRRALTVAHGHYVDIAIGSGHEHRFGFRGSVACGELDMGECIVAEELVAIGDGGQGHVEVPVVFVGNEEEVALPFGDFEGFAPHGGLSFGLTGEIPDGVHLIVEDGSAVGVANDESHRLDAVLEVGTGVDGAGHASDTYGSRHIHVPRCFGFFGVDKVLLAPCGQAEEHSETHGEPGAV